MIEIEIRIPRIQVKKVIKTMSAEKWRKFDSTVVFSLYFVILFVVCELFCFGAGLLCYDCISYSHRRPRNLDTCISLDNENSPVIEDANFCYVQVYINQNASANGKSIRVTTRSDVYIEPGTTSDEHGAFDGFSLSIFCRDENETNYMSNWNTKLPLDIKARTCYCKTDYCNAPS